MSDAAPFLAAAARVFALDRALSDRMNPREAAEAAHYAGGPSVDELERRIVNLRTRPLPAAA